MRLPKAMMGAGPGDFIPLLTAVVMLALSLPALVLLLLDPNKNWGVLGPPVIVILSCGVLLGLGFLVRGIQLCSTPGSLMYRIAYGRLFSR
jgi:hypothetical protein